MVGLLFGWRLVGTHSFPAMSVILVALAAVAMGMQSTVVAGLRGSPGTTYVTGTQTGLPQMASTRMVQKAAMSRAKSRFRRERSCYYSEPETGTAM